MSVRHASGPRHRRRTRAAGQPLFAVGAVAAAAMAVPGMQNVTQGIAAPQPLTQDVSSPRMQPLSLSQEQVRKAGLDLLIGAEARIAANRKITALRASRSERSPKGTANQAPTGQTRPKASVVVKKPVVKKSAPSAVVPVSGARMTASYGQAGRLWASGYHTGQDFSAPLGTAVRAAVAGTIVEAGTAGAYGKRIVIKHADGRYTTYNHLSTILRASGTVKAGDLIGRVGSTGNSTGPHLHFEVLDSAHKPVAPLGYLRSKGVDI